MNAGMDSQNEIELNTRNSDGAHVQEDRTERESCKYDQMDESDTRKNKEIISQEFEQDKLVNAITSQESLSPPIEPLEHNLGVAMEDPTVSQPSEIVDDESLSVEAGQAVCLEAEKHIQANEDPEQENDISADTQIIQGDSADELQHVTNSAIGYENSTTFAEADKHGSADHLKIVDCKDDEHAENLQESESENQGLATKEVDTAIEASKYDNFDQDLQYNNDAQNFENEGAQKDCQQVLLEAGSDVEGSSYVAVYLASLDSGILLLAMFFYSRSRRVPQKQSSMCSQNTDFICQVMRKCQVMAPMDTSSGDLTTECDLLPEDAECCICFCSYDDGIELDVLPCNHHFHSTCIEKWLKINAICPVCNYNILKGSV